MATLVPREEEISGPPKPRQADPCVMVIFGAAGDLTKRKLLPALHNLASGGLLPERFAVVAVARADMPEEEFRAKMMADVRELMPAPVDAEIEEWMAKRLFYVRGDLRDKAMYSQVGEAVARADKAANGNGNVLVLSRDAAGVLRADRQGARRGGARARGRRRLAPRDRRKAVRPRSRLGGRAEQGAAEALKESQIYRIDHYLGKETVQNLMVFRFANGIFEPVWNRRYVDHVQITVAETVGVEGRGGYYEKAGALRDMVQNHLFQVLALTAMEPPASFDADMVRDERVKALRAIRPFDANHIRRDIVRAQYAAGTNDGKPAPGYREEPNVDPASRTETYVAMRVMLENWRWAGVPFYLRTGKRLKKRVSEIAIQFKSAPLMLFRGAGCQDQVAPNQLIVRIQPDEGIALRFQAKIPGPDINLGLVRMDFKYSDYFGTTPSTGYETLLYDCMTGDSTLFHRADLVETAWKIVTPILDAW